MLSGKRLKLLRHCGSEEDYRRALADSQEGSVLFLKHSIT
jgi:hypothetical protein